MHCLNENLAHYVKTDEYEEASNQITAGTRLCRRQCYASSPTSEQPAAPNESSGSDRQPPDSERQASDLASCFEGVDQEFALAVLRDHEGDTEMALRHLLRYDMQRQIVAYERCVPSTIVQHDLPTTGIGAARPGSEGKAVSQKAKTMHSGSRARPRGRVP